MIGRFFSGVSFDVGNCVVSTLCVCVFLPTAVLKIEPWHLQAALGQLLVLIAMETLAEPLGSGGIKRSEMDAVEGGTMDNMEECKRSLCWIHLEDIL